MDERDGELLTPAEVAAAFRVDVKTVSRWAKQGKIPHVRTVGGHRRYWKSWVDRELARRSSNGSEKPSDDPSTSS